MITCSKCHNLIRDEFVYSVRGNSLHRSCLQCEECHQYLEETCFYRNGAYYCRSDYYNLFGPRCPNCDILIQMDEMSTKIGDVYYHPQCVSCAVCNFNAQKGHNVGLGLNGQVYCEEHSFMCHNNKGGHYEHFERDSGIESDLSTNDSLKMESHLADMDLKSPHSHEDGNLSDDDEKKLRDEDDKNKRRGPRTTIKAKQLEVLKNVFSQTPKPTRLMREQLAKETGLPMRVIQVWFQNKRSKEKRMHQMRFMARGPFLPPHARRGAGMAMRPFPPDPRFCFPPNNVGPYDYNFDCGGMPPFPPGPHQPGPPPPDFGGGIYLPPTSNTGPGGGSPLTNLDYCQDGSPVGSDNPLHSFPSPPPQNHDYPPPPPQHGLDNQYGPGPGQADQCYPSPPLSLEFPQQQQQPQPPSQLSTTSTGGSVGGPPGGSLSDLPPPTSQTVV